MDRIEIVRRSLAAAGDGTYLEIGVDTGVSFIACRAKRKWGVDPSPKLTGRRRLKYAVFAALGLKDERIFAMTSDEFFATQQRRLEKYGVTVALIDGLHTYEQVVRDTQNVLEYLRPGGFIVLHDCNPSSELMATPASSMEDMIDRTHEPGWTGAWTGDVWKAIVHARSQWDDVEAIVLDCDFGVGIIARGKPAERLDLTESDIRQMTYRSLDERRKELLGLKDPAYLDEFLARHAGTGPA